MRRARAGVRGRPEAGLARSPTARREATCPLSFETNDDRREDQEARRIYNKCSDAARRQKRPIPSDPRRTTRASSRRTAPSTDVIGRRARPTTIEGKFKKRREGGRHLRGSTVERQLQADSQARVRRQAQRRGRRPLARRRKSHALLTLGRMAFPATRLRRLRKTGVLRDMVRETELSASHLVYPMFVQLGTDSRTPIEAMPGIDRLSIAHAVDEAGEAHSLGIPAVLLFGLPAEKDDQGSGAWDDEGVVQLATRAIKEAHPDLVVITDLCLCEYTSHGHCGVLTAGRHGRQRRHARAARAHRRLPGGRRRRRDRAQRHDGRPRRRAAQAPRRRGLVRPADPRLLREVRLRVLRAVPRGGRLGARVRRPARLPDGSRRTPTRRCARRCSTSRRAPTS